MQHAAVRMGQRPAARLAAACRAQWPKADRTAGCGAQGPKASHMARGGDAHGPVAARKGRRQRGAARSGGT